MRSKKDELVSDKLKPIVGQIIKENRIKYNYSLEDLSKALNHKKNRQTLHKYETGLLNIPYELFFFVLYGEYVFCIFSNATTDTQFVQSAPHASSVCIHFLNSTIHCPRSYLFASFKLSRRALRTSALAFARAKSAAACCFAIMFSNALQSDVIWRE